MTIEGLKITKHDAETGGAKSGEYHAHIAGTKAIGKLTWVEREQDSETVRVAEHTLVPREMGGRGVAANLVDALVADAREHGFKIVPQCSYVEKKFDQNPTWSDLRA